MHEDRHPCFWPSLHCLSELQYLIHILMYGTYSPWPAHDLGDHVPAYLACRTTCIHTHILRRTYVQIAFESVLLGGSVRSCSAHCLKNIFCQPAPRFLSIYAAPCHTRIPSDAVMHNCAGGNHIAQNGNVCAFAFVGIQHRHSFTHQPQCGQRWHR